MFALQSREDGLTPIYYSQQLRDDLETIATAGIGASAIGDPQAWPAAGQIVRSPREMHSIRLGVVGNSNWLIDDVKIGTDLESVLPVDDSTATVSDRTQ